ncbi:MAG: gamma-glutamylcyclotransferase family protein, partial [Solirubrobacteraceae bacterium]
MLEIETRHAPLVDRAENANSPAYVFGYGSLLPDSADNWAKQDRRMCRLRGYRRAWNVAMDNTQDLPGYKYYRDPSGERPPIFVTFLNLVPAAGRNVNGIVFRVDPHEL